MHISDNAADLWTVLLLAGILLLLLFGAIRR